MKANVESSVGFACYMGRDSGSSNVPRFMAMVAFPMTQLLGTLQLSNAGDYPREWVVPCMSYRLNGDPVGTRAPEQLGGGSLGMQIFAALLVDCEEDNNAIPNEFNILEIMHHSDKKGGAHESNRAFLLNTLHFNGNDFVMRGSFSNQRDRFTMSLRKSHEHAPKLFETFNLYEGLPSFFLPWNTQARPDLVASEKCTHKLKSLVGGQPRL